MSTVGCRVLVVDDEETIREALRDALEMDGYTAATAADGGEGLAQVEVFRPHVVLLDMRMPKVDGWEFARCLGEKVSGRAPLIIVMTAARDAQVRAREVGADAELPKPFGLDRALAVVAECCDAANLPRPAGPTRPSSSTGRS